MTKVSVIIPAYNRAHCIERAIKSVQAQTFTDMDIIVIDDGSTDNTAEIVKGMPDERIRYIYCQMNRGSGAARSEGLKATRGEYIAFLDSDDEWLPDKIEKQVALMESLSEDWGICHGGARIIKDGGGETMFQPDTKKSGHCLKWFVDGKLPFLTPTVMLRKSAVEKIGLFDDRLLRGQDAEYFLRALFYFKLAVTPSCLAIVHMDRGKQFGAQVEQARLIINQKHEATVQKLLGWRFARLFRGRNYWIIATTYYNSGSSVAGTKWLLKAFIAYPCQPPKRCLRMFLIMVRSLWRKTLI